MAFCEAPETLGHILQSSISLQDVQSLTVAKGFHQVGGGQPAPWHALFQKMKALSTRIFGHGIPDWASHIGSASGLIPNLTEVRIHNTHQHEEPKIDSLLRRRNSPEYPKPRLRILIGPEESEPIYLLSGSTPSLHVQRFPLLW